MAKWILTKSAFDYRWESGAVTALPADTKLYVKDVVADAAIEAGAAEPCDKPADDDPAYQATPTAQEGKRARTAERHGVQFGGPGYSSNPVPLYSTPVTAETNPGAVDGSDRSEPVEETVAGNEATATAARLEAEGKKSK